MLLRPRNVKNHYTKGTSKSVIIAKTTNTRVSNTNPLPDKPFPGDKRTRLEPLIHFYEVEDDDKYDIGYEAVTYVKIDKYGAATKKTLKRLTFPVIK